VVKGRSEAYLHRLEEAEKRDHRKLSKQLDLFSTHEEVGPGLIFWHPNLATVRDCIENYCALNTVNGVISLYTPAHRQ
jgi:threonyl-tRNA synthetase